jgi:hypothetical protein
MSAASDKARLVELARGTPWFMDVLAHVRALRLPEWCVGAGAVRNLVWDALHGHARPSALADIDVAHFDADDLSSQRDAQLQQRLQPLASLSDAVATWPEFATCVGLRLDDDGQLQVIAPHGLDDLFGIVVRRNPARVSVQTYRERVASKRYSERWSRVNVVAA